MMPVNFMRLLDTVNRHLCSIINTNTYSQYFIMFLGIETQNDDENETVSAINNTDCIVEYAAVGGITS